MTKTEFAEQFKRLRVAGYRLPAFLPGESVKDLTDEWFKTFGACAREEFAHAIDELKKAKTDTFWPAPGELWFHIFELRKARKIRASLEMPEYGDTTPQQVRQELAGMFRAFATQLSQRMAMPKVSEAVGQQEAPDHVLREQEEREEPA